MSDKHDSPRFSPAGIDSLIGDRMSVRGDIQCKGALRVQGTLDGKVSCESDAPLVVGTTGTVTGSVHAAHLLVWGRVVGPVTSSQSIDIHPGATVIGDVSFRELAIHPGGILEGMMFPLPQAGQQTKAPAAYIEQSTWFAGPHRVALMATLAVAITIGAIGWTSRDKLPPSPPSVSGEARPEATAVIQVPSAAPAPPAELHTAPPDTVTETAPLAAAESVAATRPAQPPLPAPPGNDRESIVTVRGTNPSRPADVFLLISNEPSVLVRKKHGDPGEGTRIATDLGEKVSISIDPDELIRVAKGRDVTIYYQGAKVSQRIIDTGSWISLVPR
ncbi:MAG: polymer-forming cytoskeletal protein [Gammaproteobacteria bacterium]|nr:polymer-forming cytoskeletal protein [Gammaproteobacteria bacterium]MBU1647551.1 polymer-forming cytoskeletal protein [Gammaproteobacteria bacterium]MBU1973000.1 polymer-forming cytoskeletal protein [Gammaproteobacteria bacterium]